MSVGWLVNDCLTCIPGTTTFWHNLLEWFPELLDKTGGYTDYSILPDIIEKKLITEEVPTYIIRNGTYFRKMNTPNSKTISLIQDVMTNGSGFDQQIDVINHSTIVIFNTDYVYQKYVPYIYSQIRHEICPLGVDFDFFQPIPDRHPDVLPNSILFIGAATDYPKGFNILLDIMKNMVDQHFCLIMKDDFHVGMLDESIRDRVRIFNRVNKETVRVIINSCILAVCTSYEETQHLSGIECAACNIPIVSREVGVYYDNRMDPMWGCIADDSNFIEKIQYVLVNREHFSPRECFIKYYSIDICKNKWIKMINSL